MLITELNAFNAASHFDLKGKIQSVVRYGNGHINDTFLIHVVSENRQVRFILQRINHQVFHQPERLMENINRVCTHTQNKLLHTFLEKPRRRALRLIPTHAGKAWLVDADGNYWRCYDFIEGATGHDFVRNSRQAYAAANAFGAFQAMLVDLPGERLHETIPNFHHTPSRMASLIEATTKDKFGRLESCAREVEFALARSSDIGVIVNLLGEKSLPERITHNDTKLNNVLLDDSTQEGICVIDLDTVMPGTILYDFGDLVRTSTSPVAEDEVDLSLVSMQMPMFTALLHGYLDSTRIFLTPLEKSLIPYASKLITLEIGIRFLTDWLEGDIYFKINRPRHNLDRARCQFKLVKSIEEQMQTMQTLVEQS